MERFVRLVVAGGVALVAGLWLTVPFAAWSRPWLVAAALALVGAGATLGGIRVELAT